MRLILARHGNTFNPEDKVVWAGATNDLPLVKKGLEQANAAAAYLIAEKITPQAIYCSPLIRTKKFAEILVERLGLNYQPTIDKRLMEIDYGQWTGLSDQEIIDQFGVDQLKKWTEFSQWPEQGSWGNSEQSVTSDVQSFAKEMQTKHANDTIIAVSSNGRLRYFLTLITDEFEKRRQMKKVKVGTGRLCELISTNGKFQLNYWDRNPGDK
ncbi:MAG: histidine phosphatase family protein [Candidatus Obscuribacterales bacterium]|nr:histidine phosphatase family protein [Candidatus Obscuribacterales bacterium]